jgi:HlyD family secretion protein
MPDDIGARRVVYVYRGGKAIEQDLETGASDDLFLEVTSGVAESDRIITGPYRLLRRLRSGDAVKAVPGTSGPRSGAHRGE